MRGTLLHLLWFSIVSSFVACVVLVVAGRIEFANASGESDPVVVRDVLGPGNSHHLFGMVLVPQTCDELQQHLQVISTSTYEMVFHVWQEPSVSCTNERTPRVFEESLFAASGSVDFVATLDGVAFPITILVATTSP